METLKSEILVFKQFPLTIQVKFLKKTKSFIEYSETTLCKLLRSEDQTPKFDIFCFGLSFLEMILISSDISGHHTFKQICKVINNKEIDAVLRSIIDEKMRDFLSRALEFDPEKRATITELLEH